MSEIQEPYFDLEDVRRMVAKWSVDCGRRVQERRQALNIDRKVFAQLVGSTEPTIIRIEAGTMNPRDYLKLAIASALVCEVETLWPFPRRADVFSGAGITQQVA